MDFLRPGRRSPLPLAQNGTGSAPALPLLGLSVDSRAFCDGRAGADGQPLARAAGTFNHRPAYYFGGIALLPLLAKVRSRCGLISDERRPHQRTPPAKDYAVALRAL